MAMAYARDHIIECRLLSVVISGDEKGNEVSISWDTDGCGLQRVLSWEEFRQAAVTGAIMFGHDEKRMQARFTTDSHRKIVAVVTFFRHAAEESQYIGARSYNASFAF
ncbi:MAG: hypothetical protein WAP52_04000 [Candidatus Sungiibacteriota bacterium]